MNVCLYNPSINSHRLIPHTPSRFPNPTRETMINDYRRYIGDFHTLVYGFGYDCDTDDYKLLRLLEYYKDDVFIGKEACLYSLKNGAWKFVCDNDMSVGIRHTEGCLVNDVLYFVMDTTIGVVKTVLKCFNLRTETFSIVELPKFDEKFRLFHIHLREFGGCLYMWLNNQKHDSNARCGYSLGSADMWIMKESWAKLFRITDPASIGASLHIKPIVYSKDGQRILIELDNLWFGWYDLERKNFNRVSAHGLPPDNAPFDTWTFVESLVLLEKHKENPKEKTIPKKKKRNDVDGFLSSGFKLKL